MRYQTQFVVLFSLAIGIIVCQRSAYKLKQHLFNNYDSQTRPVENPRVITNICVGLYILQIVGLSEKSQIMQTNIQFVFIWNDTFLKWNDSKYGDVNRIYARSSMIWTPDIIIMDSAEDRANGYRTNRDSYLLVVKSSGQIRWQYQTLCRIFCEIDIMNFPFDEQTCSIKIRSSARDQNMVRLWRRNKGVKIEEKIMTEWFIVSSNVEESDLMLMRNDELIQFTVLKFTIKLRRVTTYYFLKILIPFSVIASITLFTFCLGEKLTLDVSILLSLVFYLQIMSEYIPRGYSKIPILTSFTLTNFFLVFMSCAMSVFVLRLYYRTPSFQSPRDNQLPYMARLVLFKYIAPVLCLNFYFRSKDEHYAKYNDRDSHFESDDMLRTVSKKSCKKSSNRSTKAAATSAAFSTPPPRAAAAFGGIDAAESRRLIDQTNASDPKELLRTLKLINKRMSNVNSNKPHRLETQELAPSSFTCSSAPVSHAGPQRGEACNHKDIDNFNLNEHYLYYEEWKQAALVMDRLFFFIFIICMPLSTVILFRIDLFEYISSSAKQANNTFTNIC